MFLRPFENQGEGSPGHFAFQDVERPDVNQNFMLGIECVEMRWSVIAPEHLDQDSVERADGRHHAPLNAAKRVLFSSPTQMEFQPIA